MWVASVPVATFLLHDLTSGQQRRFDDLEHATMAAGPLEAAGHDIVIWSTPGRVGAAANVTADMLKLRTATQELSAIRGDFLAATIMLEEQIDNTIFYYIEPGAGSDFMEWILSPMPFARKLGLLQSILKRLDLWEDHREDWNAMDAVRVERNRMAHAMLYFVNRSFTDQQGNYRLRRGPAAGSSTPPGPDFDMQELRTSLELAQSMVTRYRIVDRAISEAHSDPPDTFLR
jgi:hypothetical protein